MGNVASFELSENIGRLTYSVQWSRIGQIGGDYVRSKDEFVQEVSENDSTPRSLDFPCITFTSLDNHGRSLGCRLDNGGLE